MEKRKGKQTAALADPPRLRGWAAVGGKKEGEGPLKDCFDKDEVGIKTELIEEHWPN